MYSYISKYEKDYEGEPKNWLERRVSLVEEWLEGDEGGSSSTSDIEGGKMIQVNDGPMSVL